ncbi:desmoplakin-like isoform X3 [Brienomyrus brachyistius]|uniref:desmoplakin-like isoform X3 n=1 Tax=Brienomyrus brachyistius TaxID=42636 RepID=UPI0020B189DC|nr:desmoplakin-like isoform X3 [Brienomyrus brachyistius]
MSYYDSQSKLHTLEKRSGDISSFVFGRGETAAGNGYGADLMENYGTYRTITKTVSGGPSQVNILHQRASSLQAQCQEYLQKADYLLQSGGGSGRSKMEIEKCIGMANNLMQEMHLCAVELQNLGQPNDVIFQSLDQYQEMMQRIHYAIGGTLQRRKSLVTREDPSRNFQEAMAWIGQQKRLVETSSWGDDPSAIEQQIFNQNKFHSSIQRSPEMERAREELLQKRDKANLNMLEQEWESLQRMSCNRTNQLRELQAIIEEISREIMWVNEREEEELVSDWGDKNIDTYIPNRQENYSKLMCVLEEKERDLNKLKQKVDGLLQSGHPASEKIEAYMDTLQTQWSWLLQITKCINVHLKENAAYSQFFKDANETYSKLQNQHDTMRKRFACNRGTPLETLQELLKNLEREKERLTENKRQVQLLMSKSKNIVRLKPRNPEEKASGPVIVKALCDFKQDQKVILNGDEGILKDNSQRSKWQVTGPGGLDMLVPSVCLLVPPPNPLSIALANKNEQYYEAILALFNQLFINIKSLMSWQLCLKDIGRINSLTISMFRRMRPEEYRGLIRSLETNYQEFQRNYLGSEMFGEEDKRNMDTQYTGAQAHYNKLVVQLPGYEGKEVKEVKEVPEVKEVNEVMEVKMVKEVKLEAAARPAGTVMSRDMTILTELHNLRLRLEASEMGLTQYLHVPLRENSVQECSQRIVQLETLYRDVGTIRDEYLRLKEKTLKQLEGMTDADKAKFLETELTAINQKLGSLEGFSTAYLDRLKALQTLFQSMLQAEDIIKVHEARLTEKDTTSQDPRQVEDYLGVLKQMRMELEQKRDVLNATETKLNNVVRCNSQISQSFHKCDVDLSKYSERVGQMNDRWRRIMAQIDNRSQDLEKYLQLLRRYIQTSSTLDQWIDETGKRQDKLQAAKIDDVRVLMENLNQQKALNSEIKGKRTTVEDVQRDADTCVVSIKDYERQLAAYGAGLETLLNIPVRQTLLQSPATGISVEMGNLQSRYIELLTRSSDYYKFLGEMLKNMEELKMRNTRIDLLDEELKRLKGDIEDRNRKNKSLEDALARSEWELTQSKEQLIILEKKSRVLHDSQTQYNDLLREKENLVANIKMLEQDKSKVQRYDDEMNRMKTTLESEQREKQRLLDEKSRISKDFNYWKTQYELKDDQVRKCNSEKDSIERERNSLKIEIERLMSELKALDERYKLRLSSTEKEVTGLTVTKETLEKELWRLKQEKTVDPSMLVFDGVRKNVTAPQLCDCRVIDNATLNQLINGKKTVQDVAVDIQVNLKGTGIIAGITGGPEGKMSITEAKNKNLLTPQSATMLLEAQAATGYIIDPKQNEKMTVDMAYAKGLVDAQDRDKLITAEAASTGFKDPLTGKLLSVGQAMRKGLIDKESTLRLLQAQEAVGGILDPVLSVFLPKDVALDRGLIDDDLYRALNMRPECYIDPANQQKRCYIDLKMKSKPDFGTGLLLLSDIDKPIEVPGLRKQVPVLQLVNANLLTASDVDGLKQGKITKEDIMHRLRSYLRGSSCIAGTYDNAKQRPLSFYQAMKEGLLKPGTTLELLEAQAASGFLIDPVNNLYLTVEEALQKGLVGIEFKDNLLSAERAVTGYKNPRTDETISLFQAIEKGLIQKGHGIRLLEAQIASGGIIDPTYSHRIDVDVAYRQGYLDREMNDILSRESDETKGFFDPNTEENLTYRQLKQRCIPDTKTGLLLLPLKEQKGTQQLRKRRVVIVDPDTKIEMTVREAFEKQFIDYETYLELSSQECEWEETTFSGPDGSTRLIITDKKTGVRYDIQDCLSKGILDQATVDKYRAGKLTLKEFADKLTRKAGAGLFSDSISSVPGGITKSTQSQITSISSTTSKHVSSLSMTLSKSADGMTEQSPIGAIFDSATLEKLSISEAQRRGIIDSITAQRLLEAQACTGGIINPTTGRRLLLQDAVYQGFIDEDMAARLKPAQKAYAGFEDVKTQRMMSVAEAMKEKWLPYDAGQRFIEYQYVTGGLVDPQLSQRISLEDAIQKGWVDARGAQRLQDIKQHAKSLTCLKTKLKISYKEALDNSLVEENSGVMMLQASSMSSKGISSSYNVSSAPVSQSGSHSDSWDGSGRGSVDHSSMFRYSYTYSSNTHS